MLITLATLSLVAAGAALTPGSAGATGESVPQVLPDCGVAITATDAITGTQVVSGAVVDPGLAAFIHVTMHNDGESESLLAPGCTLTVTSQGTIVDVSDPCTITSPNTASCVYDSVPAGAEVGPADFVVRPPAVGSSFTTTADAATNDVALETADSAADVAIPDPDESQTITVGVSNTSGFGLLCDGCRKDQTTPNGIVHSIIGGETGRGWQLVRLSEYKTLPGDCGTDVCAPFGSNIEWKPVPGDAPVSPNKPNLLSMTVGKNICNGKGIPSGCSLVRLIPSDGSSPRVQPPCFALNVADPDPCGNGPVGSGPGGSRIHNTAAAADLIRIPIVQSSS